MLITDLQMLKQFRSETRIWQGIPSIAVTSKGRIFVTFYSGGIKEEFGNYALVVKCDDGVNFSEPIAVAYKDGYRCFDPCLWIDPLGRLWFTWGIAPEDATYGCICDDPDSPELKWSEPFKIGHDVMMNKPIALSSGEWLFPLAVWNHDVRTLAPEFDSKTQEKGSFVYKSVDNGVTFSKLGKAEVSNRHFDEHMVVELRDGRLMMLVRTRYGIGVSYSFDRGQTWTDGVDSGLGGPSSRFHITRLRSGRLLLINHVNFTRRNNLMAMLSDDDGKTWSRGLMLDERNSVSYPDAAEGEDGYIYITYDRERGAFKKTLNDALTCAREILIAKITEQDILEEKLVTDGSYLKHIVCKLGPYRGVVSNPYGEPDRWSEDELAARLLALEDKEQIVSRLFDIYPVPCYVEDNCGLDVAISSFMDERSAGKDQLICVIRILRKLFAPEELNPMANRIKDMVSQTATEDASLADIADQLHISRYYMCHLFKRTFGITIWEYRNSLRMMLAKRQLIETDEQIGKIAVDCGFGSASYFNELFMSCENMTPSKYRKLHK